MYIRWTNFKCPFCSATWSSRIVSAPRPDREFRTCGKCDREFRTHDIEWTHMAKGQKIGYLLNEWMVGWLLLYAMVIIVVAMFYQDATTLSDHLGEALTFLAISVVMLGPFLAVKWLTVRRSKQRTSAMHQAASSGASSGSR